LDSGVALDFDVVLRGNAGGNYATLRGVGENPAVIAPNATVSGNGGITGNIIIQGVVTAGPGGNISISPAGNIATGGGELREDGGRIRWSSTSYQNITLGGEITIDPGESLHVLGGVVVTDPPVLVNDSTTSSTYLDLDSGVALDFDVLLRGNAGGNYAYLRGIGANPASIAPGATVSGNGALNGAISSIAGALSPG